MCFCYSYRHHRDLHSFPTRRSSDLDVLGFAASGHPLSLLRGALPPGVVQSDALPRLEHGAWVEVAGLVVARQRPETAKGFIFVLLEDEAGMVNVIVRDRKSVV